MPGHGWLKGISGTLGKPSTLRPNKNIYRIYSNIRQKFVPDSSTKKWGVIL
jgi:hypothetical protein